MKRRTFIYTGVVIITGLGLSGLFLWDNESKWKKQPFPYPLVLSNILDDESLRVIGKSYRKLRSGEDSKQTLMNAILHGMSHNTGTIDSSENEAMEIEKNVEMDFKTDKMIMIKGWIISETEGRQCALLSLS